MVEVTEYTKQDRMLQFLLYNRKLRHQMTSQPARFNFIHIYEVIQSFYYFFCFSLYFSTVFRKVKNTFLHCLNI